MVPDGWSKSTLGEVAEFINGRGFKPHEWSDEGLPIIRIQNLNGSPDFNYYNGEYNPKIEVHTGDLLFAWSGSRGTSFGPHIWNGPKAVLNYHTWRVVPISEDIDHRFLFDALRLLTARIEDEAHGAAALVHTQKNRIVEYTLALPPIPEQQKIAAILSTWDRAIELTEKLIAAKQKRRRCLVHRLITTPMQAIRHHTSISGWKETRLGTLIEKRSKKSSDLESFPLFSFTIEDGVTAKTDRYERSFLLKDSENNKYAIVRFGDFVVNPMNLRFGAIGRSRIQATVSVSAYYDVFHVVDSQCDASFLEHMLKSPLLMYMYETVATGSLIEKKRVHFSEFVKISISLPSSDEQARIAAIISEQDQEIKLLTNKAALLKKQKKGLMQQLLTGKVRVNVDAEMVKG